MAEIRIGGAESALQCPFDGEIAAGAWVGRCDVDGWSEVVHLYMVPLRCKTRVGLELKLPGLVVGTKKDAQYAVDVLDKVI